MNQEIRFSKLEKCFTGVSFALNTLFKSLLMEIKKNKKTKLNKEQMYRDKELQFSEKSYYF